MELKRLRISHQIGRDEINPFRGLWSPIRWKCRMLARALSGIMSMIQKVRRKIDQVHWIRFDIVVSVKQKLSDRFDATNFSFFAVVFRDIWSSCCRLFGCCCTSRARTWTASGLTALRKQKILNNGDTKKEIVNHLLQLFLLRCSDTFVVAIRLIID